MKHAYERRLNEGRKILFRKEDVELRALYEQTVQADHRSLIVWAFACAEDASEVLRQAYPLDDRVERCLALCRAWAGGEIRMPQAKRAILDLHAMAKELHSVEHVALCHAIAQGCSTVHTLKHAMGLVLYELTALVHRHGIYQAEPHLMQRIKYYQSALDLAIAQPKDGPWAAFLLKSR